MFRQHRHYPRALVVMVLLSLLMQVQTVFACQMMEHSGHAEHCCCDASASPKKSELSTEHDKPCCDFSSEISIKDPQLEDSVPAITQQNQSLEISPAALFYFITSLWPLEIARPVPLIVWDFDNDPGDPGTHTYLSTLRLRI